MNNLKRTPQADFPSKASLGLRFEEKKLLILMVVAIITIMVDSQIGYIADFIHEQISSSVGVAGFIAIAIVFAITQYFILDYVKQSNKENRARALHLVTTNSIVSIAQYMLAGILAIVILQIIITQQYSIVTLHASHTISYGLWIGTLGLLARAFFSWYRLSNKNTMVLILALSMVAYVVNGVIGLAEHTDILTQQKSVISSEDVAQFPEFSSASLGSQIASANAIASGVAYVLTWIGTVKLLYPYINRLGKVKFWIVMGATMLYYLLEFPLFVLGYFTPSENVDAMTNVLIFSFAAILTGIIFGAAFLSVARTLQKESDLKNHMIMAAYGFLLFYLSGTSIASQAAYPPYGLVSISFIGLSCYLIYSGLYSSAVTVSQDVAIRHSIKKSVTEQSKLLDSIGTAQMEQELQSRVLTITKKLSDKMEEETGVEASMTVEDMKEQIEMVRKEFHK